MNETDSYNLFNKQTIFALCTDFMKIETEDWSEKFRCDLQNKPHHLPHNAACMKIQAMPITTYQLLYFLYMLNNIITLC